MAPVQILQERGLTGMVVEQVSGMEALEVLFELAIVNWMVLRALSGAGGNQLAAAATVTATDRQAQDLWRLAVVAGLPRVARLAVVAGHLARDAREFCMRSPMVIAPSCHCKEIRLSLEVGLVYAQLHLRG